MPPEYIFLRVGLLAPWSYCAIGKPIHVPSIEFEDIAECSGRTQVVEVTSCEDKSPWRKFMSLPTPVDFTLKDGRTYRVAQELVGHAVSGGGWFMEYRLNPFYDAPITKAEYNRRKREEERIDADDWY